MLAENSYKNNCRFNVSSMWMSEEHCVLQHSFSTNYTVYLSDTKEDFNSILVLYRRTNRSTFSFTLWVRKTLHWRSFRENSHCCMQPTKRCCISVDQLSDAWIITWQTVMTAGLRQHWLWCGYSVLCQLSYFVLVCCMLYQQFLISPSTVNIIREHVSSETKVCVWLQWGNVTVKVL